MSCRGKEINLRRAEPAGDIAIGRILVNLARRTELKQLAIPDDTDARGHRHGFDLIVRHVQDRGAKLDLNPLELETKFAAQLGVKRGQRFVHQIDGGIPHQGATDCDPLHFASGKARRPVPELAGDVQQLRRLLDALADICLRNAASRRSQRKREIVVHGQVRIQRVLLKDEGNVAASRRIVGHVAAIDEDGAPVGTLQPRDQPECRRLPGTARAEQDDKLAVVDGKRQIAHGVGPAKALADFANDDISHGRYSDGSRSRSPSRFARRIKPDCRCGMKDPQFRRPARAGSTTAVP